jgi:hypothetical protein
MKTYRVFPSPSGWCIEAEGHRVGPYRRAEMAVQLVMAQASLVRSKGMDARLVVEDTEGAVRLEWRSCRTAASDLSDNDSTATV